MLIASSKDTLDTFNFKLTAEDFAHNSLHFSS